MKQRTVIRAAAGTGKTECLAKEWLRLVASGVPPEKIIAITFTRKAAAEFSQRVAGALAGVIEAYSDGERRAFEILSAEDVKRFREVAGNDSQLCKRALASLADAPIATIDSFIQRLLTENALDIRLPGERRGGHPLDLAGGPSFSDILRQTAREVVRTDPRAHELLAEYSSTELVEMLAVCVRENEAKPATTSEILGAITRELVASTALTGDEFKAKVADFLLPPTCDGASVAAALHAEQAKKKPVVNPDPIAAWLCSDDDALMPTDLELTVTCLNKGGRTALGGDAEALVGTRADQLRRMSGATAAAAVRQGLGLWLRGVDAPIEGSPDRVGSLGKAAVPSALRWLASSVVDPPPVLCLLLADPSGRKAAVKQSDRLAALLPRLGLRKHDPDPVPAPPAPADGAVPAVAPPPPKRGVTLEVCGRPVFIELSSIKEKFPTAFLAPEVETRAERIRTFVDDLRREVTRRAFERAAKGGTLDYDTRMLAAVAFVQSKGTWLAFDDRPRYAALLVDEMQDSSPAQVDLYKALEGANPEMQSFYVGDGRQSIYLFRGADPEGLAALDTGAQKRVTLDDNYRSEGRLVRAHKLLFSPELNANLNRAGLEELECLEGLAAHKPDGSGAPPVTVLFGAAGEDLSQVAMDRAALDRLAERIRQARDAAEEAATAGANRVDSEPPDTFAVLSPGWKDAANAAAYLNSVGCPAVVDGGGKWLLGRVATDLRILLTALLDRANEMAWLGLWKHPMVGLSDQALYRVRHGEPSVLPEKSMLDPGVLSRFGWLAEAEALAPAHSTADREAFARAAPAIRRAIHDVGGRPTAEVLEDLAASLRWRDLLAVSPDPDAAEQLELALDWFRSKDAAGTSAVDLLALLTDEEENPDAPRLEIQRKPFTVSCTTIFQAKGLAYDHVCVANPGAGNDRGKGTLQTVEIGEETRTLRGLSLDPGGALAPQTDPVSFLDGKLAGRRRDSEKVRLAYVAITRAKKSVVLGFRSKPSGVPALLAGAWSQLAPDNGCVDIERVTDAPGSPAAPGPRYAVFGDVPELPAPPPRWLERTGSTYSGALRTDVKDALVKRASAGPTARFCAGWGPAIAPQETPRNKEFEGTHWGDLCHAWFAEWRFAGPPARSAIEAYLREEWHEDPAPVEIVDWLLKVSEALFTADTPLARLVTGRDPEGMPQLHFEQPVLGVLGSGSETQALLRGRTDLLVERAVSGGEKRWMVVDFKAGATLPARAEEVTSEAGLRTYGPQLEAYAAALNRAFEAANLPDRVDEAALWFVRSGAEVAWKPEGL